MRRLIPSLLWWALATTASFGSGTGNVTILTDTQGIDFSAYTRQMLQSLQQNWYSAIPASAQSMHGDLVLEFAVTKNGKVTGMKLVQGSGDAELDRAAWAGIAASDPFPPLPSDFKGPYLAPRLDSQYNPEKGEGPQWDEGEVVGRTYKNPSVGIELTPPATLQLGDPELKGRQAALDGCDLRGGRVQAGSAANSASGKGGDVILRGRTG